MKQRLAQILFSQGFGTRRLCAGLVWHGEISVHGEVVEAGRGKTFEGQPPVVTEIARGTCLKGRNVGDGAGLMRRDQASHDGKGVLFRVVLRAGDAVDDACALTFTADHQCGISREKRIATQPRAARRAVEEQKVGKPAQAIAAVRRIGR